MTWWRRFILIVVFEALAIGIIGGLAMNIYLRGVDIIGHEELPLYERHPELLGPMIAREIAEIAPLELEAICGKGYQATILTAWKISGLPRIDRIRRHLGDKREIVRAFFENSRGYERALYHRFLCQAPVLERFVPGDPALKRLVSPIAPASDKSSTD
ncbi:MAG: hypothetical protein AAF213_07510 [Pseudomonadota bacterium]